MFTRIANVIVFRTIYKWVESGVGSPATRTLQWQIQGRHFRHVPPPPTVQNFCNFMQFFGKFWQNHRLAPPPGWLVPPPMGNPGSAPALECKFQIHQHLVNHS